MGNDDDSNLFTKSEPVRGYKVVNGKKTSYSHNELDEKSRALIGDIAPKKIENSTADAAKISTSKQGTSVWNTGGTWEEKDVSEWANNSLKELILQTSYTLPLSSPAPGAVVTVEKVSKLEGNNKSVLENDDDSNLFTKSEPVRGYKVVNGKKTSYFHNELDEKSRALIGDIAPKKIENSTADAAKISTSKQGTSVWNTGGTWEEK